MPVQIFTMFALNDNCASFSIVLATCFADKKSLMSSPNLTGALWEFSIAHPREPSGMPRFRILNTRTILSLSS